MKILLFGLFAALFAECKGQAFSFNASVVYSGTRIVVDIQVPAGNALNATFECTLDDGYFVSCYDGFQFTSVAAGTHFVTIRGTSNGQSDEATLGPLTSISELSFSVFVTVSGTIITVFIAANQAATFECQLDNQDFVPCMSGFQYSGVSAGQHTITVRATSALTGLQATATPNPFNVALNAIFFSDISATQDHNAQTVTFTFTPSENYTIQCSIDGGPFIDCSSPYVIDASSLNSGAHTIAFNAIVQSAVIRGSAAQSFIVSEGLLVEFREVAYAVVEDVSVFNVTLVKQGDFREDITVAIIPEPGSARFPSDYNQQAGGQVIITPGGPDEIEVQLSVRPDEVLEFNEIFTLRLSLLPASVTAGGHLGLRDAAEVTIINDDVVNLFFLSNTVIAAEERREHAIFTVTFTPQRADIPFTFMVETFDLTARAGVDYQPLRRSVTLGQTIASENLVISILQDQMTERTKQFGARIIIPPGTQQLGVQLGSPSSLNVQIQDDDHDDLEITCFTNVTKHTGSGSTIQLLFESNRDATFRCKINNETSTSCTSPHVFMDVDISNTIKITVEGTTTSRISPQTVSVVKTGRRWEFVWGEGSKNYSEEIIRSYLCKHTSLLQRGRNLPLTIVGLAAVHAGGSANFKSRANIWFGRLVARTLQSGNRAEPNDTSQLCHPKCKPGQCCVNGICLCFDSNATKVLNCKGPGHIVMARAVYSDDEITVYFNVSDNATCTCQLDSWTSVPCTSGYTFINVLRQQHNVTINCTSTDDSNITALSNVYDLQFLGALLGVIHSRGTTIHMSLKTYVKATHKCKLNDGPFVECFSKYFAFSGKSVHEFVGVSGGNYTVIIVSQIKSGNGLSTATTIGTVTVKGKDAISISRINAHVDFPTQNYTFTFNTYQKLSNPNITILIDDSPIRVPYWCGLIQHFDGYDYFNLHSFNFTIPNGEYDIGSHNITIVLLLNGEICGSRTTRFFVRDPAFTILEITYPVCNPSIVGNNFTFSFGANKPQVEYTCSLNGIWPTPCNERTITYSNLKKRKKHVITVTASTAEETASKRFTFVSKYEKRFCKVYVCSGGVVITGGNSANVTFTSDDPAATFRCKLNGRRIRPCISPVQLEELSPGRYKLDVTPSCARAAKGRKELITFTI